jgi:hypothetical protein
MAVSLMDRVLKVRRRANYSCRDPHPIFVIVLVGPEERPYGIQKDFICDRSEYFQKMFDEKPENETVEHIVRLREASPEVFGLAQNFMYTEKVIMEPKNIPSYENLVGLWRLGHKRYCWAMRSVPGGHDRMSEAHEANPGDTAPHSSLEGHARRIDNKKTSPLMGGGVHESVGRKGRVRQVSPTGSPQRARGHHERF